MENVHNHHNTQTKQNHHLLVADNGSAHNVSHDLVGPLEDLVHSAVSHIALHLVVFQVAISTVQLQRLIAHCEAIVGGDLLGQSAVSGGGGVALVQQSGSISEQNGHKSQLIISLPSSPEHESGLEDLAGHVGQLELRGLVVGDGLLELLALLFN
jgi:hypothetical protein